MQQETPQVGPPQLPPPSLPPQPPMVPEQPHEEQSFYRPTQPTALQGELSEPFTPQEMPADSPLAWDASEYVHIEKGGLWIAGLVAVTVVLLALALWLGQWTFVVLILVMAVAMGVFAFRRPRVLHYILDNDGVEIAGHLYSYKDFRAFGILQDGAFFTMTLIPVKRFAPALSVYFPEENGEEIVDIVGAHLPMEHVQPDIIDALMRRLRF